MQQSYMVRGKVQGVMFRKTFVLGANKRNLQAGATNDPQDKDLVHVSLEGEGTSMNELMASMMLLPALNSWGAKPVNIVPVENFIPFDQHQVTTDNLESLSFSSGVEFYL